MISAATTRIWNWNVNSKAFASVTVYVTVELPMAVGVPLSTRVPDVERETSREPGHGERVGRTPLRWRLVV